MSVAELTQQLQFLQVQNQNLRQALENSRNSQSFQVSSQSFQANGIDFQAKYKKALKQIYEVIQANKQLKQQLNDFRTSRVKIEENMVDVRKEEIYKEYEKALNEKNEFKERYSNLLRQNERNNSQIQSLQAQINVLRGQNMYLKQQKQAFEVKDYVSSQGGQYQQLQQKLRQKEQEYNRSIQNYEHHHLTSTKQAQRAEQRIAEYESKLLENEKNWRNRFEEKEIQFKEIRSSIRHQYQDQINNLRKEINSLKLLNTELMTKLQTIEMSGYQQNQINDYEMQLLNSLKELRLQMDPLKKQLVDLQDQNTFEKEQAERQKTQLQLKLYEAEGTLQHFSILIKNQQDKINKLNELIKKHTDNQATIKKLEEENKILGGRVIVLESKDMAVKDNNPKKLQENVLEFQTRVEMLLNEKENLANVKNISIHQLMTLKAYIVEMDQRLKNISNQNDYATRKYKSYKEKYLNAIKQIKNHEQLNNTYKAKILGYDKLVQRLQSQLQKNVNMNQIQLIDQTTKISQEQLQVENFKKKYQSIKDKLILQQKYNKQELETVKLNYETKIVDLSIKLQEIYSLRQTINLYREKNEELLKSLHHHENEIIELKLQITRINSGEQTSHSSQSRQLVNSLQETLKRQEAQIIKLQTQSKLQEDSNRKRIYSLQKQIQHGQAELNKIKLSSSSSTRYSTEKNSTELTTQNRKLKNKISQLQNELIMSKGKNSQQNKSSYDLQFKLSSLQIETNELSNKLQIQTSHKKRLEKQLNEFMAKNSQLEAELTHLNISFNKKVEELNYEFNQKAFTIQALENQIKKLRSIQNQRRKQNLQFLNVINNQTEQDHSACENKLKKVQEKFQSLQADYQILSKRENNTLTSSVALRHQLQSLKDQKQELGLKIQRLEREISTLQIHITTVEQQKYESDSTINSLKSQLSLVKLSNEERIFEKERLITQLRAKIQSNESMIFGKTRFQQQLQSTIKQKDHEVFTLKSKLNLCQSNYSKMNETINKYNQQIINIKQIAQAEHLQYTERIQLLLQEKSKTLSKYDEQINILKVELDAKHQEINLQTEIIIKLQRQINELKDSQEEIDRLKNSLLDREGAISKNRFQLSSYEDENQRLKRQISTLKEQIQRLRFQILQKDDENSSLRLQLSTLSSRMRNEIKSEYLEEINLKQTELSRLKFQLQSLQNNYHKINQELNESEKKERKAEQELNYVKGQLIRAEEEVIQINQMIKNKQLQLSQVSNNLADYRFLQNEINDKLSTISKLRSELTSTRIEIDHLSEENQYKESTIIRQSTQMKSLRQQLFEKEEMLAHKQTEIRNLLLEMDKRKLMIEELELIKEQNLATINRLNGQAQKAKEEKQELQEEVDQSEQQWSNIQYELNQTRNQLNLTLEQLQSMQIAMTRMSTESTFLKQQLTRVNEEVISKNHQINRITQEIFKQKMQYTNRNSQEIQSLSTELFQVKRQLQVYKHNLQDLEVENRRLKIQLDENLKKISNESAFVYRQEDIKHLQDQINNKYRETMQLQLQLSQQNSEINQLNSDITTIGSQHNRLIAELKDQHSLQINEMKEQINQKDAQISQLANLVNQRNIQINVLTDEVNRLEQKSQQLNSLLTQAEEQNFYTKQHLQTQLQQFIHNERLLKARLEEAQNLTVGEYEKEKLKLGLKLFAQQTDRLKKIIDDLNQQLNSLKLKLTLYTNQEDRIQENLVTMALTFAELQSLRQRMKVKEDQINSVRRSFIQVISSSEDFHSQNKNSSLQLQTTPFNLPQGQTEDLLSLQSHSLIKYQSERTNLNVKEDRELVKRQLLGYEAKSDNYSQEILRENAEHINLMNSLEGQNFLVAGKESIVHSPNIQRGTQRQIQMMIQSVYQQKEEVKLPEPLEIRQVSSRRLTNSQKEGELYNINLGQRVSFKDQLIQSQQRQINNLFSTHLNSQFLNHQRGRTVNITYQGSQVNMKSQEEQLGKSGEHSKYQSPSGKTYIRVTAQQTGTTQNIGPTIYIPQGTKIEAVRNSVSFSSQSSGQERLVRHSYKGTGPAPNMRF